MEEHPPYIDPSKVKSWNRIFKSYKRFPPSGYSPIPPIKFDEKPESKPKEPPETH
jgi:hypothetical protein